MCIHCRMTRAAGNVNIVQQAANLYHCKRPGLFCLSCYSASCIPIIPAGSGAVPLHKLNPVQDVHVE